MGEKTKKFVAKAENGAWRIWNRKKSYYWGNPFPQYPKTLLDELNGERRSSELERLTKIEISRQ